MNGSTRKGLLLITFVATALAGCGDRTSIRGAPEDAQARLEQSGTEAEELDLSTVGHSHGSPDAEVVVVEFSDFGCPYCARFALETLPELDREFIETGQVRWQYVPFVMGTFPNGEEAARTAECAADQDRFWPMHDRLYEEQREWRGARDAEPIFLRYARELELQEDLFAACYRENRPAPRIARSNDVAAQLGVQATPSFLINGRPVQGALPIEQFRLLLQWAGAPGQ